MGLCNDYGPNAPGCTGGYCCRNRSTFALASLPIRAKFQLNFNSSHIATSSNLCEPVSHRQSCLLRRNSGMGVGVITQLMQ
eukprot:355292-Chlamydomonas_euryale.AAC.2